MCTVCTHFHKPAFLEYCKDTTDTDTKSEQSSDDYDVKVEYELVSTTDTEENPFADGSSSGEVTLFH